MTDLGLILLMAAVTYATRIIGFLATERIGASASLVKWLDRLGNIVLIIILGRILVGAPLLLWVGVAVAVTAMAISSRFLLSMWLGVAVVAAGRFLDSGSIQQF